MNSFPKITNDLITNCFFKFRTLYSNDLIKLLQAAQTATLGEQSAFVIGPGDTNQQVDIIETRIKRIADSYGQKLLIKIIESLYEDLQINGAIGVTNTDFLACSKIVLQDGSQLQYKAVKKWHWVWNLEVDGNPGSVDLEIRAGNNTPGEIVPEYILQYIQQGVTAFKSGKPAVAMALMTIGLEGTLRDALETKGYSYQYGTPSQDIYERVNMDVHKDSSGYKVTFPNSMPKVHNDYLSAPGDPTYKRVRIKRVKQPDGNFILEIKNIGDLFDYWSSDQITTTGTAQVSGLGAAINIGRNLLGIITPIDIPEDLDRPIQAVRNNLIHLSGNSMSEIVQQDTVGNDITLKEFLIDRNRVFDAICTIGNAINILYNRIASGTL
ncbi:hypothetical protein FY557_17905 [Chryseobacterium sp. SN22]|uniref:hypothetical protein n=1 Tax=Chryseobacterium sp. SN22 TaxID=2606431 RepID=UPI0011ECAA9C|nr:hypothetical protein [Chryseobacterium sp. SN22]KAA0126307.1 hypothetical protein FY557_17905 [Chryseobacterium sp. SN22]